MNQCKLKFSWLLLAFAIGMLAFTGCMTAKPTPGELFPCASDSDLTQTIAPEAQLVNFTCVVKRWEGANSLHFNVAVKNISNEDQRFKVHIFLENGMAVGGLIPSSTKKGLLKPGETQEFTYPVKGIDCAPGKIELFIKTMSK